MSGDMQVIPNLHRYLLWKAVLPSDRWKYLRKHSYISTIFDFHLFLELYDMSDIISMCNHENNLNLSEELMYVETFDKITYSIFYSVGVGILNAAWKEYIKDIKKAKTIQCRICQQVVYAK